MEIFIGNYAAAFIYIKEVGKTRRMATLSSVTDREIHSTNDAAPFIPARYGETHMYTHTHGRQRGGS